MTKNILDLSSAPRDPVERIFWLDGVQARIASELANALAECYFEARLQGRFDAAVRVGNTSRKQALKFTRQRNAATGSAIRWGDGQDPSSTNYER